MTTEPRGDLPEFYSTSDVWEMLVKAIRESTGMRQKDDPFPGDSAASDMHRVFLVEPGDAAYIGKQGGGRDTEGNADLLVKRRTVTVTLTHDYDPGAHAASYALADQDFERLEDALLVHPDAFRIAQPELSRATARRVGHSIVQTLAFTVTLSRQLPPITG